MEPVIFSCPTTNGGHQYPNFQFEADMPAVESSCDTTTGAGCTNPPPGAEFYPFYSTRIDRVHVHGNHYENVCNWQEGGDFIPGTANDYGGSSAEFGSLLLTTYPGAGFTPVERYENFNSGTMPNTCPASG
jgi:hypothetical protein